MNKKLSFFLIIFLQIIFLSAMIWFHQAKLATAQRILLRTIPYDPVSMFRGHYASLRYEINSLSVSLLQDISAQQLKGGDTLFVLLEREGDCWQAKAAYAHKPRDGRLYLAGRVEDYYLGYIDRKRNIINLLYGIESFFLNEDRALEVDRVNRRRFPDWKETEREREKRLSQLDEETRRIRKAGISEWWVKALEEEMKVWLQQGLIATEQKESISRKYTKAMEQLEEIEKDLNSAPVVGSNQRPVIVEVAVDGNGCGYPIKLFIDGKEYR